MKNDDKLDQAILWICQHKILMGSLVWDEIKKQQQEYNCDVSSIVLHRVKESFEECIRIRAKEPPPGVYLGVLCSSCIKFYQAMEKQIRADLCYFVWQSESRYHTKIAAEKLLDIIPRIEAGEDGSLGKLFSTAKTFKLYIAAMERCQMERTEFGIHGDGI